jgi:DNA transposition AAA+ family ATPase
MNSKINKNEEFSIEQISEAVKEYCQTKNMSQRELATKCGVSDATINSIINGKWESIKESMWKKIWNVVGKSDVEVIYNTRDHASIVQLCNASRNKRLMIGLIGDTGMGKTTSLKLLARKRNTYYVSYDKTMKAKQFFSSILQEMGISFEGSIYDMVNRIAEQLNDKTSNPLLIIDESGKITHNVMLYMHVLRDKTKKNCGIVLSGMPYFKNNLHKNSIKQKEGFAEFYRRINVWHELQGLSREEIKTICKESGITNEDDIREFYACKRFGDLSNQMLLHQIDLITSLIND